MTILFSAAMNFKMINKTRSVDSQGSLEYFGSDKVMYKQKMRTVKTGVGIGKRVQWQYVNLLGNLFPN